MQCRKCETQWPDMCQDCLEVIQMDFTGVIEDDVKAFEASNLSVTKKVYQTPCGRVNIASGEDLPLLLEM